MAGLNKTVLTHALPCREPAYCQLVLGEVGDQPLQQKASSFFVVTRARHKVTAAVHRVWLRWGEPDSAALDTLVATTSRRCGGATAAVPEFSEVVRWAQIHAATDPIHLTAGGLRLAAVERRLTDHLNGQPWSADIHGL